MSKLESKLTIYGSSDQLMDDDRSFPRNDPGTLLHEVAQGLFARLAGDYPTDSPTRCYLGAATCNSTIPHPAAGSTLIHTQKPAPGQAPWK
ncbi:MAG: hypothetical protein ABFS02_03965 [Pseudomonadota bacterium]